MYLALSNSLRPGGLIDPDIAAFVSASGATDTAALTQLVRYVKGESLWSNFRIYPMKSAQNAGSGATVYGLGGLTSNEITLVNSPTWGVGGIAFNGATQRGELILTGIRSMNRIWRFNRTKPTNASAADVGNAAVDWMGDTNNSWGIGQATGTTTGETISSGGFNGTTATRFGTSNMTWSASEDFMDVFHLSTTGGEMWKNKTSLAANKVVGSNFAPSYASYPTDDKVDVSVVRQNGPAYSGFFNGVRVALAWCDTTLTATQRETITDLINAL